MEHVVVSNLNGIKNHGDILIFRLKNITILNILFDTKGKINLIVILKTLF